MESDVSGWIVVEEAKGSNLSQALPHVGLMTPLRRVLLQQGRGNVKSMIISKSEFMGQTSLRLGLLLSRGLQGLGCFYIWVSMKSQIR